MGRPQLLRGKSFANLMPSQVATFIFNKTGLSKLRRRRRTLVKTEASCRVLNVDSTEYTETVTECYDITASGILIQEEEQQTEGEEFEPNEQMSLLQAKSLISQLKRELKKQKRARFKVLLRCQEDCMIADARRSSGCRRGFLLSVRKMKKHQRESEVFAQAIQCLETLLQVISTEVNQIEAIAALSGKAPTELKLFLTAEALRDEIDSILTIDPLVSNSIAGGNDENEHLFRELRSLVPLTHWLLRAAKSPFIFPTSSFLAFRENTQQLVGL